MVQLCDFCGDQRSMVYCQSDNACLCFSCDRSVHFANPISWRHSRTLICQRCNSHPAIVRCVEDKICLCQNCYWIQGHKAGPASSGQHSRQEEAINCYSGCPSAAELSTIYSFDLEFPSVLDNDDHALCSEQQGRGSGLMGLTDKESVQLNDCTIDQDLEEKKMIDMEIEIGFSGRDGTGIGNDDFFKDFNMDNIDLSLENFEQLFGPDNLFENEDVRVADTKIECAFAFEVHSATNNQAMQPAYRDQVSADSVTTNCNIDPTVCVPLSFAGPSGGGSGGAGEEYREDCKVSAMLPYGEPTLLSGNRENAVLRYMEKKKTRKFDNKIRYASRKARADTRKRVKGRFVKAGNPYDYDPLSHKY